MGAPDLEPGNLFPIISQHLSESPRAPFDLHSSSSHVPNYPSILSMYSTYYPSIFYSDNLDLAHTTPPERSVIRFVQSSLRVSFPIPRSPVKNPSCYSSKPCRTVHERNPRYASMRIFESRYAGVGPERCSS